MNEQNVKYRFEFQPVVAVVSDGRIEIDWSDSFDAIVREDTREYVGTENPDVANAEEAASALLDSLVVGVSTVEGLCQLADYIESHP